MYRNDYGPGGGTENTVLLHAVTMTVTVVVVVVDPLFFVFPPLAFLQVKPIGKRSEPAATSQCVGCGPCRGLARPLVPHGSYYCIE